MNSQLYSSKLGVVNVGKCSLINRFNKGRQKFFLITGLVAYLLSPSNLPNFIPSSDIYFVNEVAFLLFCMICHIAERCVCPSEALSCFLDHDQHFVERDRGLCTAIWNIAIVWLASILWGKKKKPWQNEFLLWSVYQIKCWLLGVCACLF